MATVKVFDSIGCRELSCFDTIDNVPYLVDEEEDVEEIVEEKNPFE